MEIQIWDSISLFVYGLGAYPVIRFYDSFDIRYAVITAGLLCLCLFVKFTRTLDLRHPIFLRPAGASDCNMSNKGGPCQGKIGMPSGHVSTATYIVACMVLLDRDPSRVKIAIGGLVVSLIALSRYEKGCHTFYQLVVGAITGLIFAFCVCRALQLHLQA